MGQNVWKESESDDEFGLDSDEQEELPVEMGEHNLRSGLTDEEMDEEEGSHDEDVVHPVNSKGNVGEEMSEEDEAGYRKNEEDETGEQMSNRDHAEEEMTYQDDDTEQTCDEEDAQQGMSEGTSDEDPVGESMSNKLDGETSDEYDNGEEIGLSDDEVTSQQDEFVDPPAGDLGDSDGQTDIESEDFAFEDDTYWNIDCEDAVGEEEEGLTAEEKEQLASWDQYDREMEDSIEQDLSDEEMLQQLDQMDSESDLVPELWEGRTNSQLYSLINMLNIVYSRTH